MKTLIKLMFISVLFTTTAVLAVNVGSSFNYQGELVVDGSPANGEYDIEVDLFIQATGGASITSEFFPAVLVENGLFQIDIDFGDVVYQNNDAFWLELSVNETGSGDVEVLAPRDRLNAVPYAVQAQYLAPNGANNGDVLGFNGSNWVATPGGASSWVDNGTNMTTTRKVGVGETTPSAQLHVTNSSSQISLLKVDDVSGTRLQVQADGRVGVGVTNPSDRFQINADAAQNAFRVQIDGQTKLRVRDNGGTALGINSTNVPDNGLFVEGDVKQNVDSNGMLKYMFRATCDATPTIDREYNGTNVTGTAGISRNSTGNCTITLPFNISSNYISATAIRATSGDNRVIGCVPFLSGMICQLSVGSTGADADGSFDVLVY